MKKENEDSTANSEDDKYFSHEAIASEIRILHLFNENYPELQTPVPIKDKNGRLHTSMILNGKSVLCLLRKYIPGNELVKQSVAYMKQAYRAGLAAAKLHNCSNQYLAGEYSNRPAHRQEYVQNVIHTIEQGIHVGTITQAQFEIVKQSLEFVMTRMDEMDKRPDYLGIVHTDLRDANFLSEGENVIPIDFGRCVYGYLLYDLGEMCAHMSGDDGLAALEIVKGYHSLRKLSHYDIVTIEAFKMLFILSVVAEQILQKDNVYVYNTLKRLTEIDLVCLLSGKPVIQEIRSVLTNGH
ncbi:hypothetical protein WQ54_17090 [Bacillus sp. SA1-12]|uniref:phosphotransferase enzyme family protein n=1 Tax=Bacillus sp. SA1-12 TaxID=1455638 RepID=UPI000627293C|nr:phosphotransferase [Bacillus sp. SA1-12]KKI91035.1 hypothetical protein WQ54_17090 [Bacillus sp. SA1-12]